MVFGKAPLGPHVAAEIALARLSIALDIGAAAAGAGVTRVGSAHLSSTSLYGRGLLTIPLDAL